MLSEPPSWSHPERSFYPPSRGNCALAVDFWGQFITIPSLNRNSVVAVVLVRSALQRNAPGHLNKWISRRDQQTLLHIYHNALRCSSRWQTCTCDSEGIFVWACIFFSLPCCPACMVGLAGRLLLCKAPLLATASIPLPCLFRESANICSEFSTCSEVHPGTLGCVRRLRVEVKAPSISGFSLSLFLGITSKQPFCSLPSLATHPILSFLERVQIGEELC